MSEHLFYGRLQASVSEVIDSGDLLPEFELAAINVLEGQERPGEEPALRRRMRAEGVRPTENRGALLLDPGEVERCSSVGLFSGGDEVYFASEWNDEFEPFPGRIASDHINFDEGLPLGLEDWMLDVHCTLAIGDGAGLNYVTTSPELHEQLSSRFKPAKGGR